MQDRKYILFLSRTFKIIHSCATEFKAIVNRLIIQIKLLKIKKQVANATCFYQYFSS